MKPARKRRSSPPRAPRELELLHEVLERLGRILRGCGYPRAEVLRAARAAFAALPAPPGEESGIVTSRHAHAWSARRNRWARENRRRVVQRTRRSRLPRSTCRGRSA